MELTIHTGFAGDETVVHVDWFDHDNVPHKDRVLIAVRRQDKPRMIDVRINEVLVATLLSRPKGQPSHVQTLADFEPSLGEILAAESGRLMAGITMADVEKDAAKCAMFYRGLLERNVPDDVAKKMAIAYVGG